METILLIFGLLCIGVTLNAWSARARRLGRPALFPENAAETLTAFVIYVALPALILRKVPAIELSTDLLVPALMPWAMLAFSATLIWSIARWRSWSREVTGALLLVVPLGNTSFFGIPMVEAYFGDAGVPYALIYDQLGSFLGLSIYGSIIVAAYGRPSAAAPPPNDTGASDNDRHSADDRATANTLTARTIAQRVVTFPPFVALLIAIATRGVTYSAWILTALDTLAATLVPMVIIAVGFRLTVRLDREHVTPFAVGLTIKLIATPLAAYLICRTLTLDSMAAKVTIFEAAMPPQISAWALAMRANLAPRLGAAMVGVGILVALVTLPGWWWVVG